MLFISLFVKTDTRHLICRPTHLPAAMGLSHAFSSGPFPPPGSPLPITHPNLKGRWGVGAPRENKLLVMRAIFRICGKESQPGLQLVEQLATPLDTK